MKKYALFFFTILFVSTQSKAQIIDNLIFTSYTIKDGLPHNAISTLIKDKKGFLWLGTDFGISRFDGTHFKNYKQKTDDKNSLKSNMNFRFALDDVGRLWVVNGGNLAYYDYKNDNFLYVEDLQKDSIGKKQDIRDVYFDNKNGLWVTTASKLCKINTKTLKVEDAYFNNTREFNHLIADKKGNIWVSSSRTGCFLYSPVTKTMKYYNRPTNDFYIGFFVDSLDRLWLSVKNGDFTRYDEKKDKILATSELLGNEFLEITKTIDCSTITTYPQLTGNNILWIATKGKGIFLYDIQQKKYLQNITTKDGLLQNEIDNIYVDDKGILWIASFTGLSKIDLQNQSFRSLSFPFIKTFVLGISKVLPDARNPEHWWIATMGDGLYKYDSRSKTVLKKWKLDEKDTYVKYPGWAYDLIYDNQNNYLWVSHDGGLLKIDKKDELQQIIIYDKKGKKSPVYRVLPSGADTLFLNLGKSIVFYTRLSGVSKHIDFNDIHENAEPEWLRHMILDFKGNLWLTSSSGLKKIDTKTSLTKTYLQNVEGKPFINNTTQMAIAENNDIWFSCINGLSKFNPFTEQFTNFSDKQGIDDGQGRFVFFDKEKKLWLYSINGLYRYDPIRNYFDKFPTPSTMNYMMQHQMPNCLSEVGSETFITLYNNYFSFDPTKLSTDHFPQTPYLTDFKIFYKRMPFDCDSILTHPKILKYKENSVSFDFTAFNFNDAERIQFSYILEGLDNTWSDTTSRTNINFTNLDAGDYVFKVKSVNSIGISSKEAAIFKFTIQPPFWNTWWFELLFFLSVLGIGYVVYRNRERQRLEKENMRLHIAQDLHDEMGSELGTISILSQLASNKVNQNAEEAKEIMQKISQKTISVVGTMRDIVWSINPENDAFDRITQRMREYAVQVIENQDIDLKFEVDPETEKGYQLPMSQRKDFLLLYKEALTNISRHSGATEVIIQLNKMNNEFILSIKDNGQGFDVSKNSSGSGLKNMSQRAKNINGKISFESEKNKGTILLLFFPVVT